ncbi:MAG TPA: alkene reductase [Stellaceae bacterium]|nr:alkene reductase [Stellaceae bacterium]
MVDLFTPLHLGPCELRNRIVMAPMTRNRAGAGNVPTELAATYYAQRAGAGLIVTEATQISPQGVGYPGTPGIHSPEQLEGWKRVTQSVHAAGGRVFLQLWHVGRISHPSLQPDGALPVAPSALKPEGKAMTATGMQPYVTPRALELTELPGIVEQFRRGAANAKAAGFDGVEVHGANGYLLDQFLRDGSNRRTDRYGGSIENRARLLLEVTEAVVGVWGKDRVGVRLSPGNPFNDMADSNPAATFGYATRALDRLGLAYLHIVEPMPDTPAPDGVMPDSRFLRPLWHQTLIVNRAYTRETAMAAVASGTADLVAFAALFLANPDLPERFRRNAPLNPPDRPTFYGGGAKGYTDYPTLDAAAAAQ